jgi:hypothetical protein
MRTLHLPHREGSSDSRVRPLVWRGLAAASGLAAAAASRRVISVAWSRLGGPEAPVNPADRRITWPQALAWALAAALGAGVARVVGLRAAAAGWQRVTGDAPPGLQPES